MKQYHDLLNLYHCRGARLLVGPEQFKELDGVFLSKPVSFVVEYSCYNGHCAPQVCGMPVTIVPWMTGVLVLPKEIN
jgi:hypothetical protein